MTVRELNCIALRLCSGESPRGSAGANSAVAAESQMKGQRADGGAAGGEQLSVLHTIASFENHVGFRKWQSCKLEADWERVGARYGVGVCRLVRIIDRSHERCVQLHISQNIQKDVGAVTEAYI